MRLNLYQLKRIMILRDIDSFDHMPSLMEVNCSFGIAPPSQEFVDLCFLHWLPQSKIKPKSCHCDIVAHFNLADVDSN